MDALGRQRLVDKLVEAYVTWREACAWVNEAYHSWARDPGPGGTLAFGVYVAALDAEEQAADVYARLVVRATRQLWGEEPAGAKPALGWRVDQP
jgi:hypothetical protein